MESDKWGYSRSSSVVVMVAVTTKFSTAQHLPFSVNEGFLGYLLMLFFAKPNKKQFSWALSVHLISVSVIYGKQWVKSETCRARAASSWLCCWRVPMMLTASRDISEGILIAMATLPAMRSVYTIYERHWSSEWVEKIVISTQQATAQTRWLTDYQQDCSLQAAEREEVSVWAVVGISIRSTRCRWVCCSVCLVQYPPTYL